MKDRFPLRTRAILSIMELSLLVGCSAPLVSGGGETVVVPPQAASDFQANSPITEVLLPPGKTEDDRADCERRGNLLIEEITTKYPGGVPTGEDGSQDSTELLSRINAFLDDCDWAGFVYSLAGDHKEKVKLGKKKEKQPEDEPEPVTATATPDPKNCKNNLALFTFLMAAEGTVLHLLDNPHYMNIRLDNGQMIGDFVAALAVCSGVIGRETFGVGTAALSYVTVNLSPGMFPTSTPNIERVDMP